jgi:hypothetical protein
MPAILISSVVVVTACSAPLIDDLAPLAEELYANEEMLLAVADSLEKHASLAVYQLRWTEGVEDAGSGNLWDAMRTLSERPEALIRRSAVDDLVIQGSLAEVLPDGATRRALLAHYAQLARLDEEAQVEYRALVEHYEAVLGPGEWRNLLSPEIDQETFPVDYRKTLSDLVADDHEAVLRGLIRAQSRYLSQVTAAAEQAGSLRAALPAAPE